MRALQEKDSFYDFVSMEHTDIYAQAVWHQNVKGPQCLTDYMMSLLNAVGGHLSCKDIKTLTEIYYTEGYAFKLDDTSRMKEEQFDAVETVLEIIKKYNPVSAFKACVHN